MYGYIVSTIYFVLYIRLYFYNFLSNNILSNSAIKKNLFILAQTSLSKYKLFKKPFRTHYVILKIYQSPLEQFDIICLFTIFIKGLDFSFTHILIPFIGLICCLIFILNLLQFNFYLFPLTLQFLVESFLVFIINLIKQQLGSRGFLYLPFIFSIFVFVLLSNVFGLLPFVLLLQVMSF